MGKAPSPPSPQATAQAQSAANVETAEAQSRLNAIDQFGPFGSSTYIRDAEGIPTGQQINLDPQVQGLLDQQMGLSEGLGQASLDALNYLPQGPFDAGQYTSQVQGPDASVDYGMPDQPFELDVPDTSNIADTYFNQQMGLMNPQFEDQMSDFEVRMSERGLPVGSEVFNDTLGDITREQGVATQQAADQAQLRALDEQQRQIGNQFGVRGQNVQEAGLRGQEQGQQFGQQIQAGQFGVSEQQRALQNALAERSQPYQDLASLGAVTPGTQLPQFQQAPQSQVANTDVIGPTYQSYNAQVQNANAMGQGISNIASAAMPFLLSDERAKENRKPANGEMVLALLSDMPVDEYEYTDAAKDEFGVPGGQRIGPMAQDWAERFGGNGSTINMPDMIGSLLASVQALDKRTRDRAEA